MRKRAPLKNINPRDIFHHADKFLGTDEFLRSKVKGDLLPMVLHPSMVMSAFASELYFKTIHCIDSGLVPPEHDLRSLYNSLPPMRRQLIKALWDENIAKNTELLDNHDKAQGQKIPRDLDSALRDCNRAFEQMRYSYEDPTSIKFYIIDLPRILRSAILEIQPTWKKPPRKVR